MRNKITKTVIIDGHYFLFRSYSIPFKFNSPKGTPLHVITTFLKLLRQSVQIVKLKTEDQMIVVFDTHTTNSNFKLSPEYKANRKLDYSLDEDSPFKHLPYIQKVLKKLNIKYTEIKNHEADDVAATIAAKYSQIDNHLIYIVSADSDYYQLLNDKIRVIHLKSGGIYEIISHTNLKQKIGIDPSQYIDFKCLTGDKADNIKGVEKIGKIRAKKIINGDLIVDLRLYKELLDLNKKLITLNSNVRKALNIDKFNFDNKIIELSNKEIFEMCDF